jgi:hypothetical protein
MFWQLGEYCEYRFRLWLVTANSASQLSAAS